MSEEKREELLKKLQDSNEFIGYNVEILSPNYISTCMLGRTKYSLNQISMDSAIGLLQLAIDNGVRVKEVSLIQMNHFHFNALWVNCEFY